MPRLSPNKKNALATRTTKDDIVAEENREIIAKVIKEDGHPFVRLSRLAKNTVDEQIERAALSDLTTYVLPRMRALETESADKPVAVNINFDLSAKDEPSVK